MVVLESGRILAELPMGEEGALIAGVHPADTQTLRGSA